MQHVVVRVLHVMLINSAEKIDFHAGTGWFMMVFGGLANGLASLMLISKT